MIGRGLRTLEEAAAAVAHPESLSDVNLHMNCIASLHGAAAFCLVTQLNVSSNSLTDLRGVEVMTRLRTLNVAGNRITSVNGVQLLPLLEHFDASFNTIASLECFDTASPASRLTTIDVAANAIDMREIGHLQSLRSLRHLVVTNSTTVGLGSAGNNPLCELPSYRTRIREMLPHLVDIDGVALDRQPQHIRAEAPAPALVMVERRKRVTRGTLTDAPRSVESRDVGLSPAVSVSSVGTDASNFPSAAEAALRAELVAVRARLEGEVEQRTAAAKRVDEITAELAQAAKERAVVEHALVAAQRVCRRAEVDRDLLAAQVDALKAELSRRADESGRVEALLRATMQTAADRAASEITQLRKEGAAEAQHSAELQRALDEARARIADREAQLALSFQQLDVARQQLRSAAELHLRTKGELEAAAAQAASERDRQWHTAHVELWSRLALERLQSVEWAAIAGATHRSAADVASLRGAESSQLRRALGAVPRAATTVTATAQTDAPPRRTAAGTSTIDISTPLSAGTMTDVAECDGCRKLALQLATAEEAAQRESHRADELAVETENMHRTIVNLRKTIADGEAAHGEEVASLTDEANEEIERKRATIRDLEARLATLTAELEALKAEPAADHEALHHNCREAFNALAASMHPVRAAAEQQQAENSLLRIKLDELINACSILQAAVAQRTQLCAEQDAAIAALQDELHSAEQRLVRQSEGLKQLIHIK